MENKKQTNGQLQKRISNAIVHIDKTKDTRSVYFDDKGLRLTVNEDYAVIETGYHRHVFTNYTSSGISKPWFYTQRLVDLAIENECSSFAALTEKLSKKQDNTDYNFAIYINWWLFNIFQPLYTIGNSEAESFFVYADYIYNIAKNTQILSEKTESVTNKQFIKSLLETINDFTKNLDEYVLFEKKTDEELIQENIDAIQEHEIDESLKNGSEN